MRYKTLYFSFFSFIALSLLFATHSLLLAEETISIATYYPSPYGSYYDLSASNNVTLATVAGSMVGVGTSNPAEKLDVTGKIKASDNFVMGWERVSNTCNGALACTATCPAGKRVISGGCSWGVSSNTLGLYPDSSTTYRCTTLLPDNIIAYAICARVE